MNSALKCFVDEIHDHTLGTARLLGLALSTACAAAAVDAQTYTISNVGLPGSGASIAAINENGQVAGTSFTFDGAGRAFFATQAGGTIPIDSPDGAKTTALAINASGQVIGLSWTSDDISNRTYRAWSWTQNGGFVDLGTLGGDSSMAVAVNDSGTVTGESASSGDGALRAFSWTQAGGIINLGALGGIDSRPHAINNPGQIVGHVLMQGGGLRAVLWNPGAGATDLGHLEGASRSLAYLINDAGQIAGYSEWVDSSGRTTARHPFLSTGSTGMIDLGTLGGWDGYPLMLTPSGQVVGISSADPSDPRRQLAFSWTEQDGLVAITLGGVTSVPFEVSASGQVVGWSGTADGAPRRAFSWTGAGGIVDLGTLGGSWSAAHGVNSSGLIVGAAALPGDATGHAFLYENGPVKDLNNLVRNKPADLELLGASRITNSKSIIAWSNVGHVLLTPESSLTAPPAVGQVLANDPLPVGASLSASASFTDAATDSHTAMWTWGDGTPVDPGTVVEANGSGTAAGSHIFASAGVYPVTLTVMDDTGLKSNVNRNVVVYDPSAGFVTGNGWIQSPPGAFKADPGAAGRATFAFVSRYQKGANIPTGTTEFRFHTADLNFHSNAYDWLVVGGARAQFKGTGTLNGIGGHRFMLTAVDGEFSGVNDRFRIKISRYDPDLEQDVVVYDNQLGSTGEGTVSEGTALGGGTVVIHTARQ